MQTQSRKTAILFDVDDTLYDQTVPFKEAYAQYFGENPAVPAAVIYPVTRKYSDQVYSQAMSGKITMEEDEVWFVGDSFPLEGALNAGWNAVWMNRRGRKRPDEGCGLGQGQLACVRSEEELFQWLNGFI